MMFLAVNFHYIDRPRYEDGIYPVSPENFSKQLDILGRFFYFISQEDLLDALEGRRKLPKRSCLITFDDGLRCQHEKAMPILDRKGIPALFFVSSLPLIEKKVCLVHKIHWLRAIIPPQEFQTIINRKIKEILGRDINSFFNFSINFSIKKKQPDKYRYDDEETACLKFLLNNLLKNKEKELVIGSAFKKVVSSEEKFVDNFYLSQQEVIKLYRRGYLGIHSHNHYFLANLSEKEQEKDLSICKKFIEKITHGKIKGISYPHGNKYNVSLKTVKIAEKLGLKIGFTMERAFNTTLKKPLLFARTDTNDVPGGKAPLFKFVENKLKVLSNFGIKRKIFFKE